uniref:NADH dehydrogenase [ubiquinone] iron-sulfur protein 5 n=1 Tax=Lygus hesperus TaxID=30085 RepID=A0A0A9WC57_LYGHE
MPVSVYFKSPLTDLFGPMINCQMGTKCNNMEMRAMNCMEAYGEELGQKKCKDLLEDLYECITKTSQMQRVFEMRSERLRQIRRGLRSEPYADGPEKDSIYSYQMPEHIQ